MRTGMFMIGGRVLGCNKNKIADMLDNSREGLCPIVCIMKEGS